MCAHGGGALLALLRAADVLHGLARGVDGACRREVQLLDIVDHQRLLRSQAASEKRPGAQQGGVGAWWLT